MASRDDAPPAEGRPLQLLRVRRQGERWQFEVCEEGARRLEHRGSRRIVPVSVCGPHRTGKSCVLNLLSGQAQCGFPLLRAGGSSRTCTTDGLWLWESADADDEGGPMPVFIDCEGFGSAESNRTRDAWLMTLCALLSSVFVFNTWGTLNEGTFTTLGLICRFAEHIEASGNEISRPEFVWLLRDFQRDLVDEHGHPMSPSEYLDRALHVPPPVARGSDHDEASDDVQGGLLRFFGQRSCVTLVRPVEEEDQLQTLDALPLASLRKSFKEGVEGLRAHLVQACRRSPKSIHGEPVSCAAFVALARQLVAVLNESATLNLPGAWEAVQRSACADLVEELRRKEVAMLRSLGSGQELPNVGQLPMPGEELDAVLRTQRRELRARWESSALGDEAVRRSHWRELEEGLDREEATVRECNCRLAEQQLTKLCKAWAGWLSSAGDAAENPADDLVRFMERAPAAPLFRAAQCAIEAASREVVKQRRQFEQLRDTHAEAEQQATNLRGLTLQEEASELQRANRSLATAEHQVAALTEALHAEQCARRAREAELERVGGDAGQRREAERGELQYLQEQLQTVQGQLQDKDLDLQKAHAQLEAVERRERETMDELRQAHSGQLHAREVELTGARQRAELAEARERDAVAKLHRAHADKEASWRENIDWIKAAAAKAEKDRIVSERAARKARWEADTAMEAKRFLEAEVRRLTQVQ